MNIRFIYTLILMAACFSFASSQRQLTEVDLTVDGIKSGTPYRQVMKLGRPLRTRVIGVDDCAGQYRRVLYFNGLEVGLLGSKNGKLSTVMSMTVTSSRWTVAPGIGVGSNKKAIVGSFGKPVRETQSRIDYVTKGNLGGVTFYLRRGRLQRIEMMGTLC